MSIDKLQEKIRKCKNPSVVDFGVTPEQIPPQLLEAEGSFLKAYSRFCNELLKGLKGSVPAVRFSLNACAVLGPDGVDMLSGLLCTAKELGYYVFLDVPAALSAQEAEFSAERLFSEFSAFSLDAAIVNSYIGSDGLRPYISRVKTSDRALFAVVRTSNRTAPELQDLLTGSRLVHMANADIINILAEPFLGRCGYAHVALMAAASSADSLRTLRSKYKNLFLLLDGYDYPNANAKNCSYAFDKLGHGAAACGGTSITAAWKYDEEDPADYVDAAIRAADRMKKNLTRYITVL